MEWNEHKAALKEVLSNIADEFGEPFVARCISETISEMEWYYNTANDTLADIAKETMMKIDPAKPTSEVYQLEGYVNRLMNRIKKQTK
jgi:HAMP domain-containing protein